jgi:hypothetical protein
MDGRKTCVMERSWRSRGDNEVVFVLAEGTDRSAEGAETPATRAFSLLQPSTAAFCSLGADTPDHRRLAGLLQSGKRLSAPSRMSPITARTATPANAIIGGHGSTVFYTMRARRSASSAAQPLRVLGCADLSQNHCVVRYFGAPALRRSGASAPRDRRCGRGAPAADRSRARGWG